MACHGAEAEGNKALNAPGLKGLPDWYIVTQLKNFKSGARGADPKDTEGMQMRPMAMTVPDEAAMANIAAYIHSIQSKGAPADSDASAAPVAVIETAPELTPEGLVQPGHETFDTMCVACHQPEGAGKVGFAPSINNRDFRHAEDQCPRSSLHPLHGVHTGVSDRCFAENGADRGGQTRRGYGHRRAARRRLLFLRRAHLRRVLPRLPPAGHRHDNWFV